MADHFYSVVLGDRTPSDVTVGTSTSGEGIELRIHDGNGYSKKDVLLALTTLENYIIVNAVPA